MVVLIFLVFFVFLVWFSLQPDKGWKQYLKNDGPIFGSLSERNKYIPNYWKIPQERTNKQSSLSLKRVAFLSALHTYWETDKNGCHRLWNGDRKNLALIVEGLQHEDVFWRVFISDLWPSFDGYRLVETDDILSMGIKQFTPVSKCSYCYIDRHAPTVKEAKIQVEETIGYIQKRLFRNERQNFM